MTTEDLKQALKIAINALSIAQVAHLEAVETLEAAEIEYDAAMNRWLKNVGVNTNDS